MNTNGNNPALHPFPEGWYFVANRADLGNGNLVHRTWLGEEIVAWCDEQGRVCVADAVCPHLGSSLAPEVGSRVREGRLVCPFHGFEYDATGQCVATPLCPAARKSAYLKVYATREIAGMVFGWHSILGRPPNGSCRRYAQAGERLERPSVSHPSVCRTSPGDHREFGGFGPSPLRAWLRQCASVGQQSRFDGAHLRNRFDFNARVRIGGLLTPAFAVSAVAHVFGLGYSQVDFEERGVGYRSRLWVLCTPVDGTSVELTIVSQAGGLQHAQVGWHGCCGCSRCAPA